MHLDILVESTTEMRLISLLIYDCTDIWFRLGSFVHLFLILIIIFFSYFIRSPVIASTIPLFLLLLLLSYTNTLYYILCMLGLNHTWYSFRRFFFFSSPFDWFISHLSFSNWRWCTQQSKYSQLILIYFFILCLSRWFNVAMVVVAMLNMSE